MRPGRNSRWLSAGQPIERKPLGKGNLYLIQKQQLLHQKVLAEKDRVVKTYPSFDLSTGLNLPRSSASPQIDRPGLTASLGLPAPGGQRYPDGEGHGEAYEGLR